MRSRLRFRLQSLLVALALFAVAAGGLRAWYDGRMAEHRRHMQVARELQPAGVVAGWTYSGPDVLRLERSLKGQPPFRRMTQLWCDEVDDLAAVAPRLAELDQLTRLHLLARQIVPGAHAAAASGKRDPLLAALSAHPTLRELIVDASIRGAPLELASPPYTREDLRVLQQCLPTLQIIWLEAN